MRKITVTLSKEAEKYFNELMYSFAGKNGYSSPTHSDCINESLETLAMFEEETENQLRNWLDDFRKLSPKEKKFVADPITNYKNRKP